MTANANQPASEAVSPAAKRRGPDLTEDPIGRLLIALAVPAGIGFFFMIAYNLVDTVWANQYPAPGEAANPTGAALARSFGPFFLMQAFSIGLMQGTTALVANALGAKEQNRARHIIAQAMIAGVLVGITLFLIATVIPVPGREGTFIAFYYEVLSSGNAEAVRLGLAYIYPIVFLAPALIVISVFNAILSAKGDFTTFGIVQVAAFFANLILDPILVFGGTPFSLYGLNVDLPNFLPELGVAGLAWATVITQLAGAVVVIAATALWWGSTDAYYATPVRFGEVLLGAAVLLVTDRTEARRMPLPVVLVAGGVITALVLSLAEDATWVARGALPTIAVASAVIVASLQGAPHSTSSV